MPNRGLASSKKREAQELAILILMASSAMLFGTLMIAHLILRVRYPSWPPLGMEPIPPMLPRFATAAHISSSIFLIFSSRKQYSPRNWWIGCLLGTVFLVFQALTWRQLFKGTFDGSNLIFSTFLSLSGVHALHTIVALIFLIWTGLKLKQRAPFAKLALWIWNFVDVAWLAIFGLLFFFE